MLVCRVACILERGFHRVVGARVCFRPPPEAALTTATDSEKKEEDEGGGEDATSAAAAFRIRASSHGFLDSAGLLAGCTRDRGPNVGSGVQNCSLLGSI